MTHDEYEQRKRRLEEELRAGVELLEAAYRHQLRALHLVLTAAGVEGVEIPPVAAAPPLAAPAPPAAPPQPVRRGPWELLDDVRNALAQVPETFDRNDVCRVLGYEPDRGSLYRTLLELEQDGILSVQHRGAGRLPTRYRRTGPGGGPANG
jgi:hypothetical protein